jgi:hypothetical protein
MTETPSGSGGQSTGRLVITSEGWQLQQQPQVHRDEQQERTSASESAAFLVPATTRWVGKQSTEINTLS